MDDLIKYGIYAVIVVVILLIAYYAYHHYMTKSMMCGGVSYPNRYVW